MRAVTFPGTNFTWLGNGADIADLPVMRTPTGVSVACIALDPAEIEEIKRTGVLWVHVLGHMPPIMISASEPPEVAFARAEQALPRDFSAQEPAPS